MFRILLVLSLVFISVADVTAGPFGRRQGSGTRRRASNGGGKSGYLSFPKGTPPAIAIAQTPGDCATGNCPRPNMIAPQALIGTKVFTPPPTISTTMEVKLSNLEQAKAALAKAEADVKTALAEERYSASREEVAMRAEYELQKLANERSLAKIKTSYDAMRLKAGLAPVDGVPPVVPIVEGD